MNCNVIQDLMILYADNCCSEDSKALVEDHLKNCPACQKAYGEIRSTPLIEEKTIAAKPFFTVNLWKASVLQSALLYCSFALLVFAVYRESATPEGNSNGLWALAVLVPVTGFLLSLANWHFIRFYSSRKAFSLSSLMITGIWIAAGYMWAFLHYREALLNLFHGTCLSNGMLLLAVLLCVGLCLASKLLSTQYARLSGKE